MNYINMTTYIPKECVKFEDGTIVKAVACRFQNSRYTCTIMKADGHSYQTGCKSVAKFKEWCNEDNILHAVLYIYHERKNEFEIVKTY